MNQPKRGLLILPDTFDRSKREIGGKEIESGLLNKSTGIRLFKKFTSVGSDEFGFWGIVRRGGVNRMQAIDEKEFLEHNEQ